MIATRNQRHEFQSRKICKASENANSQAKVVNSCEFPKAKLNRVKDFLEYLTLLHFVFFNFKVKLFR